MNTDVYGLELAKSAAEGTGKECVNKISEAIGGIFPFFGTKRQAVSTYIKDIKSSNLSPEAKMMAIANAKKTYKQLKNQMAIAETAQNVAKEGTDFSTSAKVGDEWLERFMDSAKFVSDEQIQLMWSSVLAHEFEEPNSTPPSVIRILSEMTPRYARIFCSLCSLAVRFVGVDTNGKPLFNTTEIIVPIGNNQSYLEDLQLNFGTLNELELLGLIRYDASIGYINMYNFKDIPLIRLLYGDDCATVIKYPDTQFPIGSVILTKAGRCISRFIDKPIINGHFDAVITYLKDKEVEFDEKPQSK